MAFDQPLLCPVAVSGSEIAVGSFATVQAAFNAMAVGGNNILNFSASAVYSISAVLTISNKNNWRINGNNARIRMAAGVNLQDLLKITNCDDWVISDLITDGNNLNRTRQEGANNNNCEIFDCKRFSFLRVKFLDAAGDGVIVCGADAVGTDATKHSQDGLFLNCFAERSWRLGYFIRNGHNMQFRGCSASGIGQITGVNPMGAKPRSMFDLEPNDKTALPAISQILIEGCEARGCPRIFNVAGHVFSKSGIGSNGQGVFDVTFQGNELVGGASLSSSVISGSPVSINGQRVLLQYNTFNNFGPTYDAFTNATIEYNADSVCLSNVAANNYFNNITRTEPLFKVGSSVGGGNQVTGIRAFNVSGTLIQSGASIVALDNVRTSVSAEPSPSTPWSVDLSHCLVGSGRRKMHFAEKPTRNTITNILTYNNLLRLTHQPEDAGTYWYLASAIVDNSSTLATLSGEVRYRRTTSPVLTLGNIEFTSNAVADRLAVMWGEEVVYGAGPGAQNIDFEIACQGATTVGAGAIRIAAIQKLPTDFYAEDDLTTIPESASAYTTKVDLTQTMTGDYLFLCFAEVQGLSINGISVRADLAGTKYGTSLIRQTTEAGNPEFRTWATAFVGLGLNGSTTVTIEYKDELVTTVNSIRRARIMALDLAQFVTYDTATNTARTTTTGTTPVDKTSLPVNFGPGEYILFGCSTIDSPTVGATANTDLNYSLSAIAAHSELMSQGSANYISPFFALDSSVLPSGLHTFKNRFWSGGSQQVGCAQSFIIAIDNGTAALFVSLDAVLRRGGTVTTTIDAVLTDPNTTLTASLDAVLSKALNKTVQLGATLISTTQGAISCQHDAILKKALTTTTGIDAVLISGFLQTSLDAAALIRQGALTTDLDAILFKTQLHTTVLDAVLVGRIATQLDAVLQKEISKTVGLDAVFAARMTADLDAILQGGVLLTTSLDALIGGQPHQELSAGIDAVLVRKFFGVNVTISEWIEVDSVVNG